ncbi:hypothetical protein PP707_02650, partial [Acetobacter pasteurianus]|nr:hypothetical protein [Acetobacter pasteurianus]
SQPSLPLSPVSLDPFFTNTTQNTLQSFANGHYLFTRPSKSGDNNSLFQTGGTTPPTPHKLWLLLLGFLGTGHTTPPLRTNTPLVPSRNSTLTIC